MPDSPLIPWSPDLETGHEEIDAQHKTLIETLNRLHGAIRDGSGEDELFGRYMRKELGLISETEEMLRVWLIHHILSDDQVLGQMAPEPPRE